MSTVSQQLRSSDIAILLYILTINSQDAISNAHCMCVYRTPYHYLCTRVFKANVLHDYRECILCEKRKTDTQQQCTYQVIFVVIIIVYILGYIIVTAIYNCSYNRFTLLLKPEVCTLVLSLILYIVQHKYTAQYQILCKQRE